MSHHTRISPRGGEKSFFLTSSLYNGDFSPIDSRFQWYLRANKVVPVQMANILFIGRYSQPVGFVLLSVGLSASLYGQSSNETGLPQASDSNAKVILEVVNKHFTTGRKNSVGLPEVVLGRHCGVSPGKVQSA
jgi:hypothetical protein